MSRKTTNQGGFPKRTKPDENAVSEHRPPAIGRRTVQGLSF